MLFAGENLAKYADEHLEVVVGSVKVAHGGRGGECRGERDFGEPSPGLAEKGAAVNLSLSLSLCPLP